MTNKKLPLLGSVQDDVYFSVTPDLPALRYNGPQYVFLWDDMQYFTNLQKNLDAKVGDDYIIRSCGAFTESRHFPVKNASSSVNTYGYYVTQSCNWRSNLSTSLKNKLPGIPLPIKGRLYQFNLNGLRRLDLSYFNTIDFVRRKVPINNMEAGVSSQVYAWMYFSVDTTFLEYDPHLKVYNEAKQINAETVPFAADNSASAKTNKFFHVPYDL